MEPSFWHHRWASNQIGFHEQQVNLRLRAHFGKLNLKPGNRVFVPLCGKTMDIGWLMQAGYKVVGIELSENAVQQLFDQLDLKPERIKRGSVSLYRATNLDIFAGDIFDLSALELGTVHAIYDRAALVALPDVMRGRYASHLIKISKRAPQLLVTLEYDQNKIAGPPFSVDAAYIKQIYSEQYSTREVERNHLKNGIKGQADGYEVTWLLQQR